MIVSRTMQKKFPSRILLWCCCQKKDVMYWAKFSNIKPPPSIQCNSHTPFFFPIYLRDRGGGGLLEGLPTYFLLFLLQMSALCQNTLGKMIVFHLQSCNLFLTEKKFIHSFRVWLSYKIKKKTFCIMCN